MFSYFFFIFIILIIIKNLNNNIYYIMLSYILSIISNSKDIDSNDIESKDTNYKDQNHKDPLNNQYTIESKYDIEFKKPVYKDLIYRENIHQPIKNNNKYSPDNIKLYVYKCNNCYIEIKKTMYMHQDRWYCGIKCRDNWIK